MKNIVYDLEDGSKWSLNPIFVIEAYAKLNINKSTEPLAIRMFNLKLEFQMDENMIWDWLDTVGEIHLIEHFERIKEPSLPNSLLDMIQESDNRYLI